MVPSLREDDQEVFLRESKSMVWTRSKVFLSTAAFLCLMFLNGPAALAPGDTILVPAVGAQVTERFAVLGLALKAGTDDVRESPAIEIIRRLQSEGALITGYASASMERTKQEFRNLSIDYAVDPHEACRGALLVLTESQLCSELDLSRAAKLLRLPILIDGRNLFDAAAVEASGLDYHGIGKKPHEAASAHAGKQHDSAAAAKPNGRPKTEVQIWQP